MDIRYISEFVSLAETLSYSRTAHALHLSQSSLSRHIQMMEKELGPLFVRSTRKIELSANGRIYLPWAKKINAAQQAAEAALKQAAKEHSAIITVGISHHADLYLVTNSVVRFHREHPDIQVIMMENDLSELQMDYEAGRLRLVTMAFAEGCCPKERFIRAGRIDLVAIMPRSHILSSYDFIPLHRLDGMALILPESSSLYNIRILNIFQQEGIHPKIVYQGSAESGLAMLKEGMGVMIDGGPIASAITDDSIVTRPLMPAVSFTFGLEYGPNLSRSEHQFVSYIRTLFSVPESPDSTGHANSPSAKG